VYVAVLRAVACLTIGYQEVEGNIDTVEKRILTTVNQLQTVEDALAGWAPNNAEEKQGIELYKA
jgi:hypothetical protein